MADKARPKNQLARLGDLVMKVRSTEPRKHYSEETFLYIDLSSVNQQEKVIDAYREVPVEEAPSRARQLVQCGDVLVATVRPNLNGVAMVPPHLAGATASTGFCVLRPDPSLLDGRYLFHWTKTKRFVEDMVRKATGASYPAVSDRIIHDSTLPLPPLDEQRRIAGILDKAEELRAKRRATLALLDHLPQAIFLEMFGDPVRNPKEWPTKAIGTIVSGIDSGWSPQCLERPKSDSEWGVLKLGAVTCGEFRPMENKALPAGVSPRPSIEVCPGDLLFTRKNTYELVAASALVRSTPPRLMMSDLIFRLNLMDEYRPPAYVHQVLMHPSKRLEIQRLAGGSSGSMPNISKSKLTHVQIPVPPMDLRQAFATRIEAIQHTMLARRFALAYLDVLFASLQSHAFGIEDLP